MSEHIAVEQSFGTGKLAPANAMIAELVRLYWVLGRDEVAIYLRTEAKARLPALEKTARLIDGFDPDTTALQIGLSHWSAGERWAERKVKLFDKSRLSLALERLQQVPL